MNEDFSNILPITDIDPDIQYLNSSLGINLISNCDCYLEDTFCKKCEQLSVESSYFSLIHVNIRSKAKHLQEFKLYLNNLKLDFTVIGMSESWLTEKLQILKC